MSTSLAEESTQDLLAEPAAPAAPTTTGMLRRVAAALPFVLLGVPVLIALHYYGAGWGALARFGAYGIGLIALPGVLLWRAAHGRARSLAHDFGPGLALGYAVELLGYFAGRAVGAPLAVLVAPIAVVIAFLAVRPLRRFWRADATEPGAPLGWIWANAAIAALVLLWSCLYFARSRGLLYNFNDADLPFQLALIGELKHHLPPSVPWVRGEALSYHWFAYGDMAATSWVTGIEPETILLKLYFVPLLGVLPFALGSLARQLTGKWWPGPVATIITFFGVAPYPYGWDEPHTYVQNGLGPVEDGVILRFGLFSSPTQTFAAFLAVGLVIVLVGILRGTSTGWRAWTLLAVFIATICGAKATYLPIVLCGLLLVVGLTLLFQRRWHKPALVSAAMVVPGILFAQFVLFGGASQGMVVEPLGGLGRYGLGASTGLGSLRMGVVPTVGIALAVITAITVLAWLMIWGGVVGLLGRQQRRDPAYLLLWGIGAAALGAVLLLNHYGFSQTWFLVAARPYLALAAAGGLALLAERGGLLRARAWLLLPAALVGAAAVWAIHLSGPRTAPKVPAVSERAVLKAIVTPHLELLAVAAIVALAALLVWLASRPRSSWWGAVGAVIVAVFIGFSLPSSAVVISKDVQLASAENYAPAAPTKPMWPLGTRLAAHWLRAHSHPNDLVATNAHCRRPSPCDNLHFWFAAFSERHFLIEGWGYTPTVNKIQTETGLGGNVIAYWDPATLAINDAAFHQPSAGTVGRLRSEYGVRWLFVDERDTSVRSDLLQRYATQRYRAGNVAIYQLMP